jgi:branched-chain amino acid transport system permease protein
VAEGVRVGTADLAGQRRMSSLLQATIYGLLQGGLLALVAVGFSLVWGVMNIVNLAHGSFVILGAYVAWGLNNAFGLDPFLGMFVSAAALFALGYVLQRYLINLVVNAPIFVTLLLTFGLDLLLVQGMNILFSADYRSIPTSYASSSLALGEVRVPYGRLAAFGVAIVVTLALVALIGRTRTGLSITATGMDRGAARLMGIRARHVYALTFGIAAALAGMAGAMVGTVGTFQPAAAANLTLLAFVIAVLGGLGNMYGSLVGGLLIGLVEAWSGQFLPGTWVNAIAFLALVLVLIFRPSGLVGRAFYSARVEV